MFISLFKESVNFFFICFFNNFFLNKIFKIALDAYCLIQLFDYFAEKIVSLKIDLDLSKCIGKKFKHSIISLSSSSNMANGNNVCRTGRTDENSNDDEEETKLVNNSNQQQQQQEPTSQVLNREPVRPQDIKVICDNMLGGLGKELRRCGIDTLILDNEKEHSECARVIMIFFFFLSF